MAHAHGATVSMTTFLFLIQGMGSMVTDGSVDRDTSVSNLYCNMDFSDEVIFDAVSDASCEWTFNVTRAKIVKTLMSQRTQGRASAGNVIIK